MMDQWPRSEYSAVRVNLNESEGISQPIRHLKKEFAALRRSKCD